MRTRPIAAAVILLVALLAGCGVVPVPFAPQHPVQVEEDDDFGTVEVYSVDEAGELSPAARTSATAEVWDLFVRVVTPEFAASSMTQYLVGDAPDSDNMAYVHRDDDPRF